MPDPSTNVAEMVALVERLIGATPSTPTISSEELTMRTEIRDTLITHLNALLNDVNGIVTELRDTDPRRISTAALEGHMQTIVTRVDTAFLVAHPNLAAHASGEG